MSAHLGTAVPEVCRAIVSGQLGFATADQWLFVANREGTLSTWLPEVGCSCSECALLVGMDAEFDAHRDRDGAKLVLPSIGHVLAGDERITVSISWYSETRHFIILTSSDETAKNYARSIDRRYAEILVSQQAAAVLERSLVLTALYGGADVARPGDLVYAPWSLSPSVARRVREALQHPDALAASGGETVGDLLTSREIAICKMVVEGKANKEISRTLALAEGTVKNHVSDILSKLNVRSRTELTAKVLNRLR